MNILIWLLVGVVLGVALERLVGGRRSTPKVIALLGVAVVVLLIGLVVGGYLWANSIFNQIETVEVSDQLSTDDGGGTNYLLVGSDNGRTDADQREGVEGARSDTIMVLRIEGDTARMLSLNRDLWVTNPATGESGRLNATYNDGPANLIEAVTLNFGIPIHRYVEIDFVSFAGLVDAFGGIDIEFLHPAFDLGSGLDVRESGLVHLDGDQALAYVRSRYYAERIDGEVVVQPGLPDVNRTERQQIFLRAIMTQASEERNPFTLMRAADKMSDGLRIDDDMTMRDAASLGWSLRGTDPQTVLLPVTPRTTTGGAAVLELEQPAAEAVLETFR